MYRRLCSPSSLSPRRHLSNELTADFFELTRSSRRTRPPASARSLVSISDPPRFPMSSYSTSQSPLAPICQIRWDMGGDDGCARNPQRLSPRRCKPGGGQCLDCHSTLNDFIPGHCGKVATRALHEMSRSVEGLRDDAKWAEKDGVGQEWTGVGHDLVTRNNDDASCSASKQLHVKYVIHVFEVIS